MSILNRCDLWNTLYAYSLYGTKRGAAVTKVLPKKSCVVFFLENGIYYRGSPDSTVFAPPGNRTIEKTILFGD